MYPDSGDPVQEGSRKAALVLPPVLHRRGSLPCPAETSCFREAITGVPRPREPSGPF